MKTAYRRPMALLLAAVLAAAPLCTSALAAGALEPVCDESYYATLDYYGGLMDASVVKSYQTNGHTSLTDHGAYDAIINLTDDRVPTVSNGTVTFDLGEDAPSRFYFEGKTQQPFHSLPWTFSVSYKLNGAPALAEDLAGKTGLVEIDLDVLPNPSASEYSRTDTRHKQEHQATRQSVPLHNGIGGTRASLSASIAPALHTVRRDHSPFQCPGRQSRNHRKRR